MTRVNRALLSIIIAAGMCAPVLAQPKDKAPEKKPEATQPDKAKDPQGGAPKGQLPPGMTEEDMKDMAAWEAAGKPGPMHEWLTKQAGTYEGKTKMWMKPGAPAMDGTCHTTITPIYGNRYIKVTSTGDFMGQAFEGTGIYGYDNVTKEFVSSWIDNMGTGIVTGTGSLSTDQKTLTINGKMSCPINDKTVSTREVWGFRADGTMVLEMYAPDKTGKEFKTMEITYAGKSAATAPAKTNGGTDLKAKPSDTVPGKK